MKSPKILIVPILIVVLALSSTISFASAGTGTPAPEGVPASPDGILGAGESVTFDGWWGGSCKVRGWLGGNIKIYNAGTFRMTVDGQSNIPGYCIDVNHSISTGDSWTADVNLATEADLCEANWIIANYSRNNPPSGFTPDEEGAAIQAAIWYYVAGFDPTWNGDTEYWCGRWQVKNRAETIISAAANQCGLFPTTLDLASTPDDPDTGDTVDLTATVLDQFGAGYEGQQVGFAAIPDPDTLAAHSGTSNASGQVFNSLTFPGEVTYVTASMSASSAPWTVNDVAGTKQRLLVVRPHEAEVTKQVPPPNPTAVELAAFSATAAGDAIRLDWETATELDNLGFNLYRADSPDGARGKLNADLIPSQVPGSTMGAAYHFFDESVNASVTYYYWIESVDIYGQSSVQGPVSAQAAAMSRLLPVRPRMAPVSPVLRSR